ncbi:unnamed protein product [Natator depressus]
MRQLCSLIPPQPLSCFLVQMHRLQISPLKIYRPQSPGWRPGWRPGSPGYDSDSQDEKPHCKTFKLTFNRNDFQGELRTHSNLQRVPSTTLDWAIHEGNSGRVTRCAKLQ